jgi:hypothetical protein
MTGIDMAGEKGITVGVGETDRVVCGERGKVFGKKSGGGGEALFLSESVWFRRI